MLRQISLIRTPLLTGLFSLGLLSQANAQASVFEVIHPDVKKGEIELESLTGISLESLEDGEERSVHEYAVGYGLTDFWKFTAAVEVANPVGEGPEVEAFELENLLLFPGFGGGHHHDEKDGKHDHDKHDHDKEEGHADFTLGFFTALEIPREDGISDGAIEFGPVFETHIGKVEWVGNLFVEVPFGGGDPGIAYASQVIFPVHEKFGIGFENFGEFEGAFGNAEEQEHRVGPAIYFDLGLFDKVDIEPRAAVLFDVGNAGSDAVFSFNVEYKFGG